MNLNPAGSGARMLAAATNTKGECLVAVGAAVLNGKPVLDHALTAAIAYTDAGAAHQHATHAPADFPMFFTGAGGSGDVVLSTGDGVTCIASDYTDSKGVIHWGHIGRMTLAARGRQVGGSLRGWTDQFLGYTLTGTDPSGGGGTPVIDPGRFDMYLVKEVSSPTIYRVADSRVQTLTPATYTYWAAILPAYSTIPDGTISGVVADIAADVAALPAGSGGGVTAAQAQSISDASDVKITSAIAAIAQALGTDVAAIEAAITANPSAGITLAQTTALLQQQYTALLRDIPPASAAAARSAIVAAP